MNTRVDLPDRLRYVAVEGIPGVGKSELAEKLSRHLEMRLLLEDFEDNPFLERFYMDPDRWAFQTQLAYLVSRYRQLSRLHNLDLFHAGIVADYSLDKDRIFARLYLKGDDLRLYETLFNQMARYVPKPDLVVYLQSNPDGIRSKGQSREAGVNSIQLARMQHAYTDYFLRHTVSPVLIIPAESLNAKSGAADMEELVREIAIASYRGITYFKSGRPGSIVDTFLGRGS